MVSIQLPFELQPALGSLLGVNIKGTKDEHTSTVQPSLVGGIVGIELEIGRSSTERVLYRSVLKMVLMKIHSMFSNTVVARLVFLASCPRSD